MFAIDRAKEEFHVLVLLLLFCSLEMFRDFVRYDI